MNTVNDIKTYFESKQPEYEKASQKLENAKDEFNKTYRELSKGAEPLINEFTKTLFEYLVNRLNVRKRGTSHSNTLTEIFLNDNGIEKISFHNKFYLSAYQPEFTYMIRDENLKADTGKLPMNKSPEEVGEWLIERYKSFKKMDIS